MTADADTGRSPMRTIYLMRHCSPVRLAGGKRYLGQSDPPLCREGICQAQQWRLFFHAIRITAIYCSDLLRSHHTARIVFGAHDPPILPLAELREVHLGQWEGRLFAEVRQTDPQNYALRGKDPAGHRPPGGESFQDLQDRVVPAFRRIVATTTGDVAIVCHAGVNRVLLCLLLEIPLMHLFRLGQDHGGLNIIQMRKDTYRVRAINMPPLMN
jgi:alpha-ribazole phosphatase